MEVLFGGDVLEPEGSKDVVFLRKEVDLLRIETIRLRRVVRSQEVKLSKLRGAVKGLQRNASVTLREATQMMGVADSVLKETE
jgi:hypothetical protein